MLGSQICLRYSWVFYLFKHFVIVKIKYIKLLLEKSWFTVRHLEYLTLPLGDIDILKYSLKSNNPMKWND